MEKSKTVGVVGLGRMGGPIARRFLRARAPLMVWDIDEECRAPFEKIKGAEVAPPGEMARRCAVIFFAVPSSKEIAGCLKGRAGVLRNAGRGLVLYDLTTSDPAETKKLARRAEKNGVRYLDAGMSGGPGGISEGRLTLMIGGDARVLRRTKKHLAPFVKETFHLGPVGSGHAMKLLNNMVLHTIFIATCEGARLAERMGIEVADMIEVFNASSAYSYASRHRFPNNILSGKWNAQARVYNPHKDVGLAVAIGKKLGADIDLAEHTFEFLEKAAKRGMLEEDYSHLFKDFDDIQKVRLGKKPGGKKRSGKKNGKKPAARRG